MVDKQPIVDKQPGPSEVDAPFAPEVGVGPWEGKWPTDDHLDPELLAAGDRRNVVDEFRYWKLEAIVAELDKRRHNIHIAIENRHHESKIGTVGLTATANGA